jgi:hypothetical protein
MKVLRFTLPPQDGHVATPRKGVLPMMLLACVTVAHAGAAVLPSTTTDSDRSGTALVFYAQPEVKDDLWPLLFRLLRADLAAGAGDLGNGVVLDKEPTIVRGSDDLKGISFTSVVSVKLLGRCDRLPQAEGVSPDGPLGWVVRVSGKIQPFVYIDCARLARELRPATATMDKPGREQAMAQGIAHVLIHEWGHIAAQNPAHGRRGLTRPYLSADDLMAAPPEPHLSASRR